MTYEQAIKWCKENYANVHWLAEGGVWITNGYGTVDVHENTFIESVEMAIAEQALKRFTGD